MIEQGKKDGKETIEMGEGVNALLYINYCKEFELGQVTGSFREYIDTHESSI